MLIATLIVLFVEIWAAIWAQGRYRRSWRQITLAEARWPSLSADAAVRQLLRRAGLDGIAVRPGPLTTAAYDPATRTIRLPSAIAESVSPALLAVIAHEVGHAVQDRDTGWVLALHHIASSISPIATALGLPTLAMGGLAGHQAAVLLGSTLCLGSALLSVAAVAIEVDATRRGLALLSEPVIARPDLQPLRDFCYAAALTYLTMPFWLLAPAVGFTF